VKPARSTPHTRILRAAIILILVTLAGGVVAAPAQAAAFRFWGYFQLTNGAWAFAQTGPAQAVPKDGSVDGWRFAVADESSTRTPRATLTFKALCAGTAVTADTKRVGLVIDYGRAADAVDSDSATAAQVPAPRATCVAVPKKASGSDVLAAAGAKIRQDNKGLTCTIDGWPTTGCGESVAHVSAAAASPDTKITIAATASDAASHGAQSTKNGSTSSRGVVLGGLAAVVLVAALGFGAWRRSRDITDD
jgi:hypothetical protein